MHFQWSKLLKLHRSREAKQLFDIIRLHISKPYIANATGGGVTKKRRELTTPPNPAGAGPNRSAESRVLRGFPNLT